jgi:hypothetical protein
MNAKYKVKEVYTASIRDGITNSAWDIENDNGVHSVSSEDIPSTGQHTHRGLA